MPPLPPHLDPLPEGEEIAGRREKYCHTLSAVAVFLSLGERTKVRACPRVSRKLDTSGKPLLQRSAASGVAFEISSCTGTSSAGNIPLETESSIFSATRHSLPSNWMARDMVTRAARRQTWRAQASCWRAAFASSASGTTKCWPISHGLSRRSSCNWTSRSRAGAALILPHLNPLPEVEEARQRQVRVELTHTSAFTQLKGGI